MPTVPGRFALRADGSLIFVNATVLENRARRLLLTCPAVTQMQGKAFIEHA